MPPCRCTSRGRENKIFIKGREQRRRDFELGKGIIMRILEKALSEIKPYERNPRVNKSAITKVSKSIQEYGFKQPLVIDKYGVIVVGHTRYEAAKILGMGTVPCVIADDLNEEQIKAYRLADNKTADYSLWDNKKLLDELDDIGFDIFTGFEVSDIFYDLLDESDNSVLEENEHGVLYEIKLTSSSKEKIEKVKSFFEGLYDV